MYGGTLLFVLILIGGVISYIGDRIGMKVGHKRLTLFGLRPRHTSIIVTILTGFVITGASAGILSVVSEEVRNALFHMREIQTALAVSEQRYGELNKTLEESRAELSKTSALLEAEQKRVESLQEIGERLQGRIEQLQATEAELKETLKSLGEKAWTLYQSLGEMQEGNLAFRANEIILATVIEGGRSREWTQEQLRRFLESADTVALTRGARVEGKESALAFSSDSFFQAARVISEASGKFVVRVNSQYNSLIGDPVLVYFELCQNQLVFKEGEVITERVVEGGAPSAENEIMAILSDVNRNAITRGMLTDESGLVGKITGEEFLRILSQVRRSKGKLKIVARSAKDTWAAEGPLAITLTVEKVS